MLINRAVLAGLAALLLANAPALGQQSLPREALTLLRESCSGSPARLRPGAVQTADLNGDGRPDYVINFAAVDCTGGMGGFCGSGGCSVEVILSTPAGYRDANIQVLGGTPQIVRSGGLPTLRIPSRGGTFNLRWNGRELARVR